MRLRLNTILATCLLAASGCASKESATVSGPLALGTLSGGGAGVMLFEYPETYTRRTSANFVFILKSGVVSALCSVDGSLEAPCVSPVSLTGLSEGDHRIAITDTYSSKTANLTYSWRVDTTPPQIALAGPNPASVHAGGASVAISWAASDSSAFGDRPIRLYYSADGGANWTAATNDLPNSGAYSWTLPGIDSASVRLRLFATDLAGNQAFATSPGDFTIDSSPPTVSLGSMAGGQAIQAGASQSIDWSASDSIGLAAQPVRIEYSSDGGATWSVVASSLANTGHYAWTAPADETAEGRIRVSAEDTAGNVGRAASSSSFFVDSTAPSISSLSFSGGTSVFASPAFLLDVQASDGPSGSGVRYYRYSESAAFADSGWLPFGGGSALQITCDPSEGTRPMYVWVKDAAGNVSARASIDFSLTLNSMPTITSFRVSSSANPSSPPTIAQLSCGLGDTLYLQWTGTAAAGLPPQPFSLQYSADQVNWTDLAPSRFGNVASGSTDASGSTSAYSCPYAITQPFYLRLGVTDLLSQVTYRTSTRLNASRGATSGWRLLGGTTGSGIGGRALSANMTFPAIGGHGNYLGFDPQTNRVYFYDGGLRHLTYVDPGTGNWVDTGVALGYINGGMAIDSSSARRALYWSGNYDANVSRVSLTDFSVTTLYQKPAATGCQALLGPDGALYTCTGSADGVRTQVVKLVLNAAGTAVVSSSIVAGNGANGAIDETVDALSSPLPVGFILALTPAGELVVGAPGGAIYRLRSSDRKFVRLGNPPFTSSLYSLSQGRTANEVLVRVANWIYAVDVVADTGTALVGTGEQGLIPEGADALATPLFSQIGSMAVTPAGRIYFLDGYGVGNMRTRILTIDSFNKVRRVGGVYPLYGDGVSLEEARFSDFAQPSRNPYDGAVYVVEPTQIRKVDLAAGTIARFAGNGIVGAPSGPLASAMFHAEGWNSSPLAFLSASAFTAIFPGCILCSFDGSAFSALLGSAFFPDSASAPLSDCDGQNASSCGWRFAESMAADGAGNAYVQVAWSHGSNIPSRLFKIDGSGTVNQILGSNANGYSPDCAAPGCARTLPFNFERRTTGALHWDAAGDRLLFVDHDGSQFQLRAVTASGSLQTIGAFTGGYSPECSGVFDRSRYYYFSTSAFSLFRMDTQDGSITALPQPPVNPCTIVFTAFTMSDGGNLVISGDGALYEFVP